jgi:hypothetical protein
MMNPDIDEAGNLKICALKTGGVSGPDHATSVAYSRYGRRLVE